MEQFMEQTIAIRQQIIGFYKKFEIAINYILKFLVALFIFSRINTIGLYREEFYVLFETASFAYLALISLIFTLSPPAVALFLVALAITIQLSAVLEVAVFVFLLMMLLIIFYARLDPRRSMLILAMVFGFFFNMPYAVAMFAGLYFGISSMIPIILGTAVWYFLPFFTNLAQTTTIATEFDLFELPVSFMEVFGKIYEQLTTDFSWIVIGFVLAMVALAVHLISRIAINYSKDIAIAAGAVIGIICMIMVVTVADIDMSIGGIFLGSILSALLVLVVKFFDNVLDYKRVERVVFDDEDNYYYVKIVPKVKAEQAEKPEKTVRAKKPIRPEKPERVQLPKKPAPVEPEEYTYHSKPIERKEPEE
ncbi:MAG: hypothetical protein FWC93_01235 [Defluviitaleaceae bacterium]|nr:hypothetical protein [Defluviitaleaceae bacterium]